MAVELGPDLEAKDFNFKVIGNFSLSSPYPVYPTGRVDLLAVSNKYGFVFVGCASSVRVYETKSLLHRGSSSTDADVAAPPSSSEPAAILRPPADASAVIHVSLSCDDLTLAAVFAIGGNLKCFFFDVRALAGATTTATTISSPPLRWFSETLISSGAADGDKLLDLQWNPAAPLTFAAVTSAGKVTVTQVGKSLTDFAAIVIVGAKCLDAVCCCWSPKGKQIVVGLADGSLVQFTPELVERKRIDPPPGISR